MTAVDVGFRHAPLALASRVAIDARKVHPEPLCRREC